MCESASLVSALSTFLPLLAATPEPALPSLLPQLATLRAALLATLQEQEEGDDSGLGKTMLEGKVEVEEAVSVEEAVEVPRWLAPGVRRVQLVLQGGPSYELTKARVEAAMGEFGALESCTLAHSSNRVGASGWVVYRQEAAALRALHRLVQVGECEVYTRPACRELTGHPVPHQVVMMLSRPVGLWDRDLQVRRTFARHGEVAAVEWRWSGGILRLLVSFKEKVAEGLVGSEVEVFKEKVVVREVTGFTMMD